MPVLVETQQALDDLPANNLRGSGQHAFNEVRVGTEGRYMGSIPFDPREHFPSDIDPLSPTGIALDEDYVRLVRPVRPLTFAIVLDHTARNEHPVLTSAKRILAENIGDSLDATVAPGDRVNSYIIKSDNEESDDWRYDTLIAEDDATFTDTLASLVKGGLTIMISDFRRVDFARPDLDLSGMVAIKTNHKLERHLPKGIGIVSLTGYNSVNTSKRRELHSANELLEKSHNEIVSGLENTGAGVASVVIDAKAPGGYDLKLTDQAIAKAIRKVTAE